MAERGGQPENEPAVHTIYLGLGSNLGDRLASLRTAVAALAPAVRITAISSVYETTPLHVADQPDFLNLVCAAETSLAPVELLHRLKAIERALGRAPGPRFGPRAIDLDLLLYDDLVLDNAELTIPHPRMRERAFVLVPLAEVAPHLRHPTSGATIAALAAAVGAAGVRCIGPLLRGMD